MASPTRAFAYFADEFANVDPFFVPTVQECVREPNQRLIDLLRKPGRLTALEWREVELLAGDDA